MHPTIERINATLTRVKIRIRSNRLYLRATLPARDGSGGKKQQEIATGLPNTADSLRVAKARAQRLESDLNLERFKWSDWTELPDTGGILVKDALEKFELWYWETRARTPGREEAFRDNYLRFLRELPPKAPLTTALLRETLIKFPADSFYRQRAHLALGFLARRSKIPLPDDWKELKGKYKAKSDRYIPTDQEIENIHASIQNQAWRWIFGIIATYGLRPHEIFHLDLSRLPVLKVLENTKSGARLVYPVPGQWVTDFQIADRHFPNFNLSENLSNISLGNKISIGFNQRSLGVVPYGLRDAYAVRCAVYGVDSTIAAKWMGHSIDIHVRNYQKYIDEIAMAKIWERLNL
jgi:integrase